MIGGDQFWAKGETEADLVQKIESEIAQRKIPDFIQHLIAHIQQQKADHLIKVETAPDFRILESTVRHFIENENKSLSNAVQKALRGFPRFEILPRIAFDPHNADNYVYAYRQGIRVVRIKKRNFEIGKNPKGKTISSTQLRKIIYAHIKGNLIIRFARMIGRVAGFSTSTDSEKIVSPVDRVSDSVALACHSDDPVPDGDCGDSADTPDNSAV